MTKTGDSPSATEELLPFWVNGSLDTGEGAQVERAITLDPTLEQQANVLRRIRSAMKVHASAAGPGELGLARLHRAIDRDGQPRDKRLFRVLTAVAAVLATLLIINLSRMDMQADLYRPASGEATTASITVAFRSGASVDQVSELLLELGLTVVEGPSALGFFELQPLEGTDLSVALAGLAEHSALLEVIEHQE